MSLLTSFFKSPASDSSIFPAILDKEPLFFVHMGSLHEERICGLCGVQSSNTECLSRCDSLPGASGCRTCGNYNNSVCLKSCEAMVDQDISLYRKS